MVAQSGEEAIELAERFTPDIILLDILMPGIDGFETCRHLKTKEATKDIPVIFMTTLTDTVDKVKGYNCGGVDYITKPLHHEEVLVRVKTHLSIQKLHQRIRKQNILLEKQYEQLQKLNASKDKFFSNITHDIRNHLQSVTWLCEAMAVFGSSYGKDEIKNFVQVLQESAQNLNALLENLLLWSKIQQGTIEYNKQPFDVRELIDHNITLFSSLMQQKQITLLNSMKQPLWVCADKNMINAVVRNLISNALKFTEIKGTVRISEAMKESFVSISISDTGIGISEDDIQGLFQIDVKSKKTGTAGEKGTGLGLIICKELIVKNGGSIRAESEPGRGSTFTFTLLKAGEK
jgi:two-component system sensor histidine kinase/response regulator